METPIKILYVEDDATDQFIMKRTLKSITDMKCELTIANSLHEGELLASQVQYDCIFLDYMLPDGSGIDFLKTLKNANIAASVIIFTSQTDTQIAVKAMKKGVLDYIPKDHISADSISQSLRYVLRLKSAEAEKQRLWDELVEARKVAEEAAAMKEQFLANMSHEIRTPMSGIMSLTKILMTMNMPEEQLQYLKSIKKCSDSLLVIINDILDLSKIQAGKMTIEAVPFEVREVITHTCELFSAKAAEKNIALNCSIQENIPSSLIGDQTRLSQILNNLVNNAIKFTEKGAVEISVTADRSEKSSVYNLYFAVKDSGIGISEDNIGKIFESFTQAGNDTARKFGGTGLGLTIVKKLVELQRGNIKVESTLGEGTTFHVTLPFSVATVALNPATTTTDDTDVSHLRLLIAEDNMINQLIVKKLLEPWKCSIDFAETGLIAFNKLKASNYDIVLMDVQMPEMDGNTASQKIRTELPEPNRSIPIMAMTAHVTQKERERCFECGMDDYISKPFDLADLKTKLIVLTTHKKPSATMKTDPASAPLNIETGSSTRSSSPTKINLTYLKQVAGENQEFITQMIEMFLQKTPQALEEMEQKFKEQNWEDVRNIAHRIKPTYTYVGLTDINKMLAKIEKCCQAKENLDALPQLIEEVELQSTVAFAELEEELKVLK